MSAQVFAVVLAGGSGTRFWPASRRSRPKQLLALGPGEGSLIQQTVHRLLRLCPPERIKIATGAHLLKATQEALPMLPSSAFMGEPCARNTAPCIGWAVEQISREHPDAVVVVVPSDQYIRDTAAFEDAIRCAVETASAFQVVTLGIQPTRPETGYGYIQAGPKHADGAYQVERFVEKPDRVTAERYLQEGNYYWNAGMFIFRASQMLTAIELHLPKLHAGLMHLRSAAQKGPDLEARATAQLFAEAESISIDFGVMEKLDHIAVVPADIGWSDLGSFEVAWELAPKDANGNAAPPSAIIIDSEENLVLDYRHHPSPAAIALVGVRGMCVVQTDDGLLVIPRDRSQEVRRVVEHLAKQPELL